MISQVNFSVVIPAYNRADTIGIALRSVLEQVPPAAEVIVVDDGSTDATAQVVRKYGASVRLIQQGNRGAAAARNVGVWAAQHRWVAFLDSDDMWSAGHLGRMRSAIKATGGRAVYYFSDTRMDATQGDDLLWNLSGMSIIGDFEVRDNAKDWVLMPLQPMMLQSSVFNREALLRNGGMRADLRCRHDTHLFLVMGLGRPACAVAGCGAVMSSLDQSGQRLTVSSGSETRSYWEETVRMYESVLRSSYEFLPREDGELRSRLCAAHLRLAKFARKERWFVSMMVCVGRALLRHKPQFFRGVLRQMHFPRTGSQKKR